MGDATIGYYSPTIIANDGSYYSTQTFNWTVSSPISFNDPGDQTNTVGDTANLPVNATDASSGTISYAALGLPNGLSISSTTGQITGTISLGCRLHRFIRDHSVRQRPAPTPVPIPSTGPSPTVGTVMLATPSNQTGTEGTAITTLSLSATDSTSGATLHYFAQNLPPGLAINPANGHITGTPATNDSAAGSYGVFVIATDGTSFAQESFVWTIASPVTFSAVASNQTNSGGCHAHAQLRRHRCLQRDHQIHSRRAAARNSASAQVPEPSAARWPMEHPRSAPTRSS